MLFAYVNITIITINDHLVHVSTGIGHMQVIINRNEVVVAFCTCRIPLMIKYCSANKKPISPLKHLIA
jgi:hypothetical protein